MRSLESACIIVGSEDAREWWLWHCLEWEAMPFLNVL